MPTLLLSIIIALAILDGQEPPQPVSPESCTTRTYCKATGCYEVTVCPMPHHPPNE